MDTTTRQQFWQRISKAAGSIVETTNVPWRHHRGDCSSENAVIEPLQLPSPDTEAFCRELRRFPLTSSSVAQLMDNYEDRCAGIGSSVQSVWAKVCRDLPWEPAFGQRVAEVLAQRYTVGVQDLERTILTSIEDRLSKLHDDTCAAEADTSSSSSNDDDDDDGHRCQQARRGKHKGHSPQKTAILELAYSHTQSITHAEKLALAQQTGLQPRQVTIWFQNRRNRAAKKARMQAALGVVPAEEADVGHSGQQEDRDVDEPSQPLHRRRQERKRKLATLNTDIAGPRRPQGSPSYASDEVDVLLSSDAEDLSISIAATKKPRFSDSRSLSAGSCCSDSSNTSGLSSFSFATEISAATSVATQELERFSSAGSTSGDECTSAFGETSVDQPTFTGEPTATTTTSVPASSRTPSFASDYQPQQPQHEEGRWVSACKSSTLANALILQQTPQNRPLNRNDDLIFAPGSNVPRYDLSDLELSPQSLTTELQHSYNEALTWSRNNTAPQSWSQQSSQQSQQNAPGSTQSEDEWEDVEMDSSQPRSHHQPPPPSITRAPRKNRSRYLDNSTLGMALLESPSRHARRSYADQMTPTQGSFQAIKPTLASGFAQDELSAAWLAELEAMLSQPSQQSNFGPQEPVPCITLTDVDMGDLDLAAFGEWATITPASSSSTSTPGAVEVGGKTWSQSGFAFVPPPQAVVASSSTSAGFGM